MAAKNFAAALAMVLVHEGGYVNHPADPGGATNRGVTQKTYDRFRSDARLPTRSVRHITEAEIAVIYRKLYWDAIRGNDLPGGADYAVFDFAVNSGGNRAAKFLQNILSVTADGRIGSATLRAVLNGMSAAEIITRLCDDRIAFLRGLKTYSVFGRGWDRRVGAVRIAALKMVP